MSAAPTYEQLRELVGRLTAQVVELERMVREQADEIVELKRQASADSVEFLPAAVIRCAVVEAAGEEALVAQQVGAQAGQAAGRVVVLAEPGR